MLAELGELGDLIAGSFFEREMNGVCRHCLSRMVGGRQRQVYVSEANRDAVRRGVRQYRRAMEVLRELGETNLELVKKGVVPDDD